MYQTTYTPPLLLKQGLSMTLYTAFRAKRNWHQTIPYPEPLYQPKIFTGEGGVPLFGLVAMPAKPKGTIIGTYGITGDLDNQWLLKILGRKAFANGYGVVLFDWRAHGKTATLSPTLTSDGLNEGKDFIHIAAQAKKMGFPAPFWFTGYSLGGQLALWGIQEAANIPQRKQDGNLNLPSREKLGATGNLNFLGLEPQDIGGAAVICPNLDSNRSLSYLEQHPWGKYLEQAIAKELKKLIWFIHQHYPEEIEPAAIERANTIRGFDHEFVIKPLGFSSVQEYYTASSPLRFLKQLQKPTLILYAADDPMFEPSIIDDLDRISRDNPMIKLILTRYGGHVGYISSVACQRNRRDPDRWWAWNRILEWCESQERNY